VGFGDGDGDGEGDGEGPDVGNKSRKSSSIPDEDEEAGGR
jgi:hypothetical protein